MRRNNLKSGILLCGCLIFSSCSKQDNPAPEIEVISPNVTHLSSKQSLEVDIDTWENQLIDHYEIHIESESGFAYFDDHKPVHKSSHKIWYEFDLDLITDSEFSIKIKVTDNDGQSTEQTIGLSLED